MKNGTKKYIQEMNCENYQTINPTELTLIYDFWTTVFRLSKHKEWIDLYEICEEIKKPEYVEDWFVKIFIFVYYAEDENILEINRGNGKFRLIPGKKLSLIKQLIEQLGRPDKKYNDH